MRNKLGSFPGVLIGEQREWRSLARTVANDALVMKNGHHFFAVRRRWRDLVSGTDSACGTERSNYDKRISHVYPFRHVIVLLITYSRWEGDSRSAWLSDLELVYPQARRQGRCAD